MQENQTTESPIAKSIRLQEQLLRNTRLIQTLEEVAGELATADFEFEVQFIVKNKSKLKDLETEMKETFGKEGSNSSPFKRGASLEPDETIIGRPKRPGLEDMFKLFGKVRDLITVKGFDLNGEGVAAKFLDVVLTAKRAEQEKLQHELAGAFFPNAFTKPAGDGADTANS